jgi:hypothetical protein
MRLSLPIVCSVLSVTTALLAPALSYAGKKPTIEVVEARLTEAKWRSFLVTEGGQAQLNVGLPQLWVYDRDGRLLQRFEGPSPDVAADLQQLVQRGTTADKATEVALPRELKMVEPIDYVEIDALAPADLTFISYWADPCDACDAQFTALLKFLATQPKTKGRIFHVKADKSTVDVAALTREDTGVKVPARAPSGSEPAGQ